MKRYIGGTLRLVGELPADPGFAQHCADILLAGLTAAGVAIESVDVDFDEAAG